MSFYIQTTIKNRIILGATAPNKRVLKPYFSKWGPGTPPFVLNIFVTNCKQAYFQMKEGKTMANIVFHQAAAAFVSFLCSLFYVRGANMNLRVTTDGKKKISWPGRIIRIILVVFITLGNVQNARGKDGSPMGTLIFTAIVSVIIMALMMRKTGKHKREALNALLVLVAYTVMMAVSKLEYKYLFFLVFPLIAFVIGTISYKGHANDLVEDDTVDDVYEDEEPLDKALKEDKKKDTIKWAITTAILAVIAIMLIVFYFTTGSPATTV